MALLVTMYLSEADTWLGRPAYEQIAEYLEKQNIAGATLVPGIRGFTRRGRWYMDTRGKRPIILTFVDTEEQVQKVLPELKRMAPHRLITSEKVNVEQAGSLHEKAAESS